VKALILRYSSMKTELYTQIIHICLVSNSLALFMAYGVGNIKGGVFHKNVVESSFPSNSNNEEPKRRGDATYPKTSRTSRRRHPQYASVGFVRVGFIVSGKGLSPCNIASWTRDPNDTSLGTSAKGMLSELR